MFIGENNQPAYSLPEFDCEKEIRTVETEKEWSEMLYKPRLNRNTLLKRSHQNIKYFQMDKNSMFYGIRKAMHLYKECYEKAAYLKEAYWPALFIIKAKSG